MAIVLYQQEIKIEESLENFKSVLHSRNMKFLASDLLKEGLSISAITDALNKAIEVAKNNGIDINQHFAPVYTQVNYDIVKDCKLTKFAFGLVLINANHKYDIVAKLQIELLKKHFI